MHMPSKKGSSSGEQETLRMSRNSTTVVAANGEMQTDEEAQVYVHDLDLFIIVQLLDGTSAVLSPGKLREEYGCTYGWTIVQKPHLTKNGKRIPSQTEHFVPLVIPGLPSNSGTSSSSTSFRQDSSTSPSPAILRSDDTYYHAPGDRCNPPKIRN